MTAQKNEYHIMKPNEALEECSRRHKGYRDTSRDAFFNNLFQLPNSELGWTQSATIYHASMKSFKTYCTLLFSGINSPARRGKYEISQYHLYLYSSIIPFMQLS